MYVTSSPSSSTAGGGGGGGPSSGTVNTGANYCLNYGTSDSTACLINLLSTPGVYQVPVPNFVYYVRLNAGIGGITQLHVASGVQFYGNNCTFYLIAPTPYGYDPVIGWHDCLANGVYTDGRCDTSQDLGWYNDLMDVDGNTVVSNVTFIAPVPISGININPQASNILLEYISFPSGLQALFFNWTQSEVNADVVNDRDAYNSVKRAAVSFGGLQHQRRDRPLLLLQRRVWHHHRRPVHQQRLHPRQRDAEPDRGRRWRQLPATG